MSYITKIKKLFILLVALNFIFLAGQKEAEQSDTPVKIINSIVVTGNSLIPTEALLVKVPFAQGDIFNPALTAQLIRNLYGLKYFESIEVAGEDLPGNKINLHIIVKEKKKLESVQYKGTSNIKNDEIEKKLKLSELPAMSEEEAKLYAEQIQKFYAEKDYHNAQVTPVLSESPNNNLITTFDITEGPRAIVKRVCFEGNKCFSSKKLRSILFTREDWLFSFMDKSGTYQQEMIEYDKHVIENFYQSNGFLMARVIDAKVDIDPITCNIKITFCIDEGELFTINAVSAIGNNLLSEEQLLAAIPIKPGQLYNKEAIRQTMEMLRMTWGQFGYIYADIDPAVSPNLENKTVDITFYSELGSQIFLNRINLIGNSKTRDKVIRRAIVLNEGELLTTQAMEISKARVESLGFFDPAGGVDWKINKISEGVADLDLLLKEIKTGKLYGQIGYGGADPQSPSTAIKLSAGVSDRNFLGTGIRYNLNVTYSKEDRGVNFNVFQPWLLNRPIGAGLDAYMRRSVYEDFKSVQDIPVETITGATGTFTYAPLWQPDLGFFLLAGSERISYARPVIASSAGKSIDQTRLFQEMLNRRFQSGTLTWFGFNSGQDLRNHPVFPSRGYNWNISTKLGVPAHSCFGYFKVDADATWLTPLIGEYDLIFLLHGHFGYVKPFNDKVIPYRELYHVGGPATVRGFTFGQIGPHLFGDSIGATKAFWVNAELIFSVTADQSIRAVVFYDGGAGWDTPNAGAFANLPLVNNRFNYRHAIGFGVRLTKPAPVRIDWGFKLDRNKRLGETISEVHFTMAQDF